MPAAAIHGYTQLVRRGTQVVRERSAKPLCVGSIPTRASNPLNLDRKTRQANRDTNYLLGTFLGHASQHKERCWRQRQDDAKKKIRLGLALQFDTKE